MDFTGVVPSVLPAEYGAENEQLLSLDELFELIEAHGKPVDLAIEIEHPSPYETCSRRQCSRFWLRTASTRKPVRQDHAGRFP